MAIAFVDWTTGTSDGSSTTHTLTYPSTINSGDLLLLSIGIGSDTTLSFDSSNMTVINHDNGDGNFAALDTSYRVCNGTEDGGTFGITLGSGSPVAWVFGRFTGVADPATSVPDEATRVAGLSTSPDPPSVTLTGGSQPRLLIASLGLQNDAADDAVNSGPTSYTTQASVGGQFGAAAAQAYRIFTTSGSENPSTFALQNTQNWVTNTFGLFEAAVTPNEVLMGQAVL